MLTIMRSPATLILEKFQTIPEKGVGATKYHLEELRNEYLDRELRQVIRSAAEAVSDGEPNKSIEMLSVIHANSIRKLT